MKQKRTLALLLTGVMTLSALAMTGCGVKGILGYAIKRENKKKEKEQ